MARLVIGIIVGVALSLVCTALFSMWQIRLSSNILTTIGILLGANFEFNMIDFITGGDYTHIALLQPAVVAWLVVGYIGGSIAKGAKRGLMTGLLVLAIVLLVWILLNVLSGEDLLGLFTGSQLMVTLGGIVTGAVGGVVGGLLGGISSGPYEEFY